MSVADKAEFSRRMFVRYGVLVDFEGDVPARLVQALPPGAAAKETLGQFCKRVLGEAHGEVTVFQGQTLPAQTRLDSVKVVAGRETVSQLLKPPVEKQPAKAKSLPAKPSVTEVEAVKEAAKQRRRADKLEKQLLQVKDDLAQLRKSKQRMSYGTRSIDALVAKLEGNLESKVPVHAVVAAKVRAAVGLLEKDAPLCDAVWPLVEMANLMAQLVREEESKVAQLQALLDKPQRDAA